MKRRQSLVLVVLTAAAVLVAAGGARAENSTAANANFVLFGQVKSDVIGPTASNQYQWYKLRLVPGRSYSAYAWAPDADPSETTVSLDFTWWLDNGTTAAGGVGTSEAEPIPNVTDHNGDVEYIRPTTTDCAVTSGCTFRLRLAAASAAAGFTVNVLVVETTLFSPWWQVGNGYDSAPQIRNNTTSTLSVTYTAYNAAGTVVCTKSANIAGNGTLIFGLGSSVAAGGCGIASGYGSAQISFLGPPGAFTANSTTLGSASGLSFDAPFTPRTLLP